MSHNCEGQECAVCEERIDQLELNKINERIEPAPLKNDSLMNRGNPDSRYYDGN
jgi:hypothetical protein